MRRHRGGHRLGRYRSEVML